MLKYNVITKKVEFDHGKAVVTVEHDGKFDATFVCDPEDAPRAGETVEIEIIV